jgi:hypothetical protein
MVTDFAIWRAMSGNGAATGVALITTRCWPTKAAWQTIRKAPIHRLIRLSPTRKSAFIAAPFSATINIARATLSALAAKGRSTPGRIILASAASGCQRTAPNARPGIDACARYRHPQTHCGSVIASNSVGQISCSLVRAPAHVVTLGDEALQASAQGGEPEH